MPEGDTIYRAASSLRNACKGKTVQAAVSNRESLPAERVAGQVVADVEARGKHLLIHFSSGHAIHSHMGMTGSWHLYPANAPWKKPKKYAAMSLDLGMVTAVCFSPKVIEMLSPLGLKRHPRLQQLGPDILGGNVDVSEVLKRMRVHQESTIGEVVMNQTVLCGVGNVYKSEILFLETIHPLVQVAALPDDRLLGFITSARRLMLRNLDGRPRRTRFSGGSRMWVYGRRGKPCFQCGERIVMQRQGDQGRSTYWCPMCQASECDR